MGEVQNNARENEKVNEDVMRAEKIAQAKGQGKSHADAVEGATAQTDTQVRATSDAPEGGGENVGSGEDSQLTEAEVSDVLDQAENADETDGAN